MSTDVKHPFFSVIIPAYNARDTIREAVLSVLSNDVSLEVVVVDDGSAVPVRHEDLPPGPVRLLVQRQNGGTARARNLGIAQARGDWIAFLDSDDVYEAHRLDRSFEVLRDGLLDGVITGTLMRKTSGIERLSLPNPDARGLMHLRTAVICAALIVRKSALQEVGFFDPHWHIHEDADLWIRLMLADLHIGYMPKPAYVYRINEASKTHASDPILGLHEFRGICWRNAASARVSTRNRVILLGRGMKWEARALPHHWARLRAHINRGPMVTHD